MLANNLPIILMFQLGMRVVKRFFPSPIIIALGESWRVEVVSLGVYPLHALPSLHARQLCLQNFIALQPATTGTGKGKHREVS